MKKHSYGRSKTMKILGICGTNKKNGKAASEWFLNESLAAAAALGAATESIRLIQYNLKPCTSCDLCFCGKDCPLFSDPEDDGKELFDKVAGADGLIFSSPVYSYQQPACVINFIQRSRVFHERERGRLMGLRSLKMRDNPFSGKPVGNLAISATIGNEGALSGLLHNLRGLGAAPVICAGISLMEPVIKEMYKTCDVEKINRLFNGNVASYTENQEAIDMARSVGRYIYKTYYSEVFQKIKYHIKL
ncbi:MAG: NAD(P)H-dependent oxidoreductase [Candidatus Omnitrophica bacterium]|nr:NAD(P)H-dependent oxidoreductase [Candidatus Omnitrophota bacterium]